MKRHESLRPFSREHHSSLILAQLLKKDAPAYKGLPENELDKIRYALHMFTESIELHFRREEQLLEKIQGCHPCLKDLADQIYMEHRQLEAAFKSLAISRERREDMDSLGKALEKHIRKEERILFPLIEKHCPATVLSAI